MGLGMGVCMDVLLLNKSLVHSYLCVCVCNGSAIKEAARDVCVSLCTHKIKCRHGCVSVSVVFTLLSTASYLCMYVYVC